MKALTLNEFIDNKIQQDDEFTKHYEREQIIDPFLPGSRPGVS